MTGITVNLWEDEALKPAFESIAKGTRTAQRSAAGGTSVVVQEQRDSATYLAWFHREVTNGIREADAGDVIPESEVEARFVARRNALRHSLGIRE